MFVCDEVEETWYKTSFISSRHLILIINVTSAEIKNCGKMLDARKELNR